MNLLHGLGERDRLENSVGDALPSTEFVGIALSSALVRDNGHNSAGDLGAAEGDLRSKSGAQAGISRKGQLGDAFKNG